jgi:hypothetical protein
LHDAAAVDFHCLFRCAQFSGNLFVQHTPDDKLHYFELARRQQIKKTPSLVLFANAPSLLGGPNQRTLDALEQFVSSKRLPKKIDRARFHRLRAHRDVAVARDKYELLLTAAPDQIFLELDSI